jgi:hypothetical protein
MISLRVNPKAAHLSCSGPVLVPEDVDVMNDPVAVDPERATVDDHSVE